MAKYIVSKEGIDYFKENGRRLSEDIASLWQETEELSHIIMEYEGRLGPHSAEIEAVLEQIKSALVNCAEPAERAGREIEEVADRYEQVLQTIDFKKLKF